MQCPRALFMGLAAESPMTGPKEASMFSGLRLRSIYLISRQSVFGLRRRLGVGPDNPLGHVVL